MAPHVFMVDPSAEPDARGMICVHGDEARHASQVVRLRVGEVVDLVDGEGRRFTGEAVQVTRDRVEVRVSGTTVDPAPQPRVIVIQALAKGDRGERAVEAMTEIGVDVIIPWAAERCVTRWVGDKATRGVDKWRATAWAATKQSRRSRLPQITDLHATGDLVPWISGASIALCLDEASSSPLAAMTIPSEGGIVLIVGPEGGISPVEMEQLTAAGATMARLGPTVLRTSTAGPVASTVVLSRTPRWGSPA